MSEYLVEVTPGRELVYRTPLALRAAIRSGEITADSRIFHRTSSTWVPITQHPEYRKIQAELNRPSWLEPLPPPQQVAPAPSPEAPRLLHGLAARVASGWSSIKKRFNSTGAAPSASASKPAAGPKPRSTSRPNPPPPAPDNREPDPGRDRWTFFP